MLRGLVIWHREQANPPVLLCFVQRALLTPQVNSWSRYSCVKEHLRAAMVRGKIILLESSCNGTKDMSQSHDNPF